MTSDPAVPFPPLREPVTSEDDAAALVRSVLGLDDIVGGSLLLLLCDEDGRPTVPVLIADVPVTMTAEPVVERWFEQLGEVLADTGSALIFARGRAGQSFVLDHDRPWHDAVMRGCAQTGIELLAAFVVTAHAVVPFPTPVPPGAPALGLPPPL